MKMIVQQAYQPGDPPPEGYLAWHEWAHCQHKAGLRQEQCGRCGLWRYPQELSSQVDRYVAKRRNGQPVTLVSRVCSCCVVLVARAAENLEAQERGQV